MSMNSIVKLWLLILLIVGFSFFVFLNIWYLNESVFCSVNCDAKDKAIITIIIISLTGLFVGTLTSYFTAEKVENREKKNISLVYRFLEPDERKVVRYLVMHKGSAIQSKISRELNMSRVRVSRVLKVLEAKEIISKKENGMTNLVQLKPEFKMLLVR